MRTFRVRNNNAKLMPDTTEGAIDEIAKLIAELQKYGSPRFYVSEYDESWSMSTKLKTTVRSANFEIVTHTKCTDFSEVLLIHIKAVREAVTATVTGEVP